MKRKGFDSPDSPYMEFPSTSAEVQYIKGSQKQIKRACKSSRFFFIIHVKLEAFSLLHKIESYPESFCTCDSTLIKIVRTRKQKCSLI